ncbi:MAG: hypothetical protein IJ087_20895 [Eggerthellaceae bacterium]|nr:hypothetical protein [Eggerthellaceae bacterium]
MTNHKFQEQIDKACSTQGWDQGNDTDAPNNQAMSGGVSTVKEKCNAATNNQDGGV